MTTKQVDLTKNFFALGLMFWLYERSMDPTLRWIDEQVRRQAGHRRGQQARAQGRLRVRRDDRDLPHDVPRGAGQAAAGQVPQHHRQRGDRARLRGGVRLAKRELFMGSYPITPASDILHQLSGYKNFGVKTFQAEDEIAAIGPAIGAAYGGAMGLTASSGPGIALKRRPSASR